VAVRRRARDVLHADVGGGAATVLDHHRLAKALAQSFGERAGKRVRPATRRVWNDHADWPVWKALGCCRQRDEHEAYGEQGEEPAHGHLPKSPLPSPCRVGACETS
jgi:hypothetical protein